MFSIMGGTTKDRGYNGWYISLLAHSHHVEDKAVSYDTHTLAWVEDKGGHFGHDIAAERPFTDGFKGDR